MVGSSSQANSRSASQASQAAANQAAAAKQNAALQAAQAHSAEAGSFGTSNQRSSAANRQNNAPPSITAPQLKSNPSISANVILAAPKTSEQIAADKAKEANLFISPPPPKNRENNPIITNPQIGDKGYSTKTNTGTGFGGGKITFDKSGNTLQGGKIVSFAGQQAKETFLAKQGLGNNATVVNAALFSKADFRPVASFNISGVAGDKNNPEPTPYVGPGVFVNAPQKESPAELALLAKTGNAGQAKLTTGQPYRGSAKEDAFKASEADRASVFYNVKKDQNQDYLSGGKSSNPDWVPPVGNHYFNMGQVINNSNVRGSAKETALKTSEAERASVFLAKGSQKEYGNNPVFTIGGTKYPVKEEQTKSTAKQGNNPPDLIGLTDTSATKGQSSVFASLGGGVKTSKPLEQTIADRTNQIQLSNWNIEEQNTQARQSNIKSEADLKSFLSTGEKQDAIFTFYSGNKQVEQSSGQKSFRDFLTLQNKYSDLSIQTTYPAKEKALTQSIQKNTDFFETLPQNYWNAASQKGYFSQNNEKQINTTFQWNLVHHENVNLAIAQGTQPAFEHGGIIQGEKGLITIGPRENEVASFLRVPFSGSKEYNQFISGLEFKPVVTQKTSTSFIPSTSYANVLQFWNAPYDLIATGAIKLIDRSAPKLIGLKNEAANKIRLNIAERTLRESANYPKPEEKTLTLEPGSFRGQKTIRPSNMFRKPLGVDILNISRTEEGRVPVSARQNEPRNTLFEDTSKETQAKNTQIQNSLLSPATPKPNPPASTNIPFFKGRIDQFGRAFASNISPYEGRGSLNVKPESTPSSSSRSLINQKGPLPFAKPTEPNTQLSPVSREFFGVQFKGTYPTSYLPPSSGLAGSRISKPVEFDIFYSPSKNIDLGFGESTSNFISEIPKNLGQRKNLVKENQQIYFGRLQNDLLSSKVTLKGTKSSELLPEFINPLGRRGKPAIQKSYPTENIMSRAEFVSSRKFSSEDFLTSSGKKGSASAKSFGALRPKEKISQTQILPEEINPLGRRGKPAIKSTSNESILSRSEVVEKTRPIYSNEVFSSKGVKLSKLFGETSPIGALSRGTKTKAQSKTIELSPQKDYQDWRFSEWSKKNPEPELIGNARMEAFFKKLPSRNTKSAVVTNNLFNEKGVKAGFIRRSKNIFESKPITQTESKKGEVTNTGSKGQTSVLLNKPLTRKRAIIETEQKYDYEYEFKPIPQGRSESGLASGIMSGLKSGTLAKFVSKTGQKQEQGSMLASLNKNLAGTKTRSSLNQKPRQISDLFTGQAGKQSLKQTPQLIQSPKQGTKPKQTSKQIPKLFTNQPQQPKPIKNQKQSSDFSFLSNRQTPQKPRRILPVSPPLWGPASKGGKGRSKSGPTGLYNLNVNNIFSSSLSIKVAKGQRYEF